MDIIGQKGRKQKEVISIMKFKFLRVIKQDKPRETLIKRGEAGDAFI